MRQGWARSSGVVRPTDASRVGDDRRRHRSMSRDLLDIAQRIAGLARDSEEVEAYVARSRDTDIRVYQGEIESLATAEAMGIGVRVVYKGRQGFAYAGALDDDVC